MRIHRTGPKILRVPDVVPRSVIDVGFLAQQKNKRMLAFLKSAKQQAKAKSKTYPVEFGRDVARVEQGSHGAVRKRDVDGRAIVDD